MDKYIYWWFARLLFKFMNKTTGLEHDHKFWEGDVRKNLGSARCDLCGLTLDEANKKCPEAQICEK